MLHRVTEPSRMASADEMFLNPDIAAQNLASRNLFSGISY